MPRALRCRGSRAFPSGVRGALGEAWRWQHSSVDGASSIPGDVCAAPAEASGIVHGFL